MKRKIILILSAVMLIALLILASANMTKVSAETYSGSCGEGLTYDLDTSTGTLTISGCGSMIDYLDTYYNGTYVTTAPWGQYYSSIKTVTINNGVTSIGGSAFYGCMGLTSITIPDSVTSIGEWAFYNCAGLTSITIPDSVTIIGDYAFEDCTGLTSIIIPNSVTSIGVRAFSGCTGLTSIIVKDDNPFYQSIGNCLIESSTKELMVGCQNSVIPNDGSITSIGSNAFFFCTGLTSIAIPDSVTSIGYGAFEGCKGLTSITIPDSVTSIGNWAFAGCTGLTSITIPDSVTSIGEWAFHSCTGLTSITIPDSVTRINWLSFDGCPNITVIVNKGSVAEEVCSGAGIPFVYKSTGVSEPPIQTIALTQSTDPMNDGMLIYTSCGFGKVAVTGMVNPHYEGSVVIPESYNGSSVFKISAYAFYQCYFVTEIVIPNTVNEIEGSAFISCASLKKISIPSSVISIGLEAFNDCGSLEEILVDNKNATFTSNGSVLIDKKQKSIIVGGINPIIPDDGSVIKISDGAFYMRTNLTAVHIPDSVSVIGQAAFKACNNLKEISIPYSITRIEMETFAYCDKLESVLLPPTINFIDNVAFSECNNLTITVVKDSYAESFCIANNIDCLPVYENTFIYMVYGDDGLPGSKTEQNTDLNTSSGAPEKAISTESEATSNTSRDTLIIILLIVCITVLLIVLVVFVYLIVKKRRNYTDRPTP